MTRHTSNSLASDFPDGQVGKNTPANARDMGSNLIPEDLWIIATKPMFHSYWAAAQPVLEQEKLHTSPKPASQDGSSPGSPQLESINSKQKKPQHSQNK